MRRLFFIMMAVLACTFGLSAQLRTISGTVLDATNNEPLIGVTVAPIGGGQGVATDVEGNFTIKVPQGVTKAKFTYVGYNPATVDLRPDMKVYLQAADNQLQEMVVVAYGTDTKESLTGSVAVVGEKEIENRPVNSVTTALEGMAPGVQVSSTTAAGPGGSPSILIRGINTVNGVNTPLYVVDGVIFNGTLAEINPDDVESMSVLKDAASCALYGAKGANGVILITTRKAKNKGKVDVTLKVSQGIYERGLPFYETLGANGWMETILTAATNGQYSLSSNTAPLEDVRKDVIKNFYNNIKVWNIYGDVSSEDIFSPSGKVVLNPLSGYDDLDWWDAMSQNGYRQEYNVSVAAAQDKFNVFASTGYLKSQGYLINTDFERFSSRINLNVTPVSYFRFGVNANLAYQESQDDDIDTDNLNTTNNPFNYTYRAPVFPYYNHNPKTGAIIYDENGQPEWNTNGNYKPYESNIAYLMRSNSNSFNRLTGDLSVTGTAILPYGFELSVRGDMYRSRQGYKSFGNPWIGSAEGSGRLRVTNYYTNTYNFMQTLNWAHEYGNHHVDVMLNHENYSYDYGYSYTQAQNMVFSKGPLELTNFATNEGYSAYHIQRTTESYMGRARYNYDQKYFGEVSLRRDGTSRFAKDVRWGTFWSVGASWILTKEKFMQDINWIDYLKLRAAYGTAGSDAAASSYAYWSLYAQRAARVDNQLVMSPSQLGADKAKWEDVRTLDIALEGNLLNNRLNFSIGYFLKKNVDLLYNLDQPASAGGIWNGKQFSILTNIGTMQNVGWELSLRGNVIETKDWKWGLHADASFIKNKIISIPYGDQYYTTTALLEGYPRWEFYMPTYAGVDMYTGRALYEINPSGREFLAADPTTGEMVFSQQLWDQNIQAAQDKGMYVKIGDRHYTTNTTYASKQLQGTSLPTVFGSFGTNLEWKGISLTALFTYSLGGKVYDDTYASLMSYNEDKVLGFHKDILNSWQERPHYLFEGSPDMDNVSIRVNDAINPEVNSQYTTYDNAASSRWLTSASYLQFKNLAIGYSFPKNLISPLKLSGLNVGFNVENLFTCTARKGINPAYNYSGGQGNYFVVSRVYNFQLTARF